MIKKILIIFLVAVTSVSCKLGDDNDQNLVLKSLPIKEAVVPAEFEFGMSYTIKVEYDLPDGCHSFYDLYYKQEGTSRIVAITAIVDTKAACTEAIIPKEHEFVVNVAQQQDYTFRFWKGEDNDGNDIFEDVVVPVIN
ncbi:hypothetical protein UMM65_05320 [Aureibaculum sp. 2210JD6-5]|uniref:hypothetical protein n=1 Tax=Aureibaculum sp. 2210JD6-5 TaxID=3103957 RepID=UPI002AAD4687|nr:hypothetical protein [Aureibaculum sp. 2210JD6-5]MDY7394652.1 hypothetical protein [Aureibaculum sp. 2210JD6-5]